MDDKIYEDLKYRPENAPRATVSRRLYRICLSAWTASLVLIPVCIVFNRTVSRYSSIVMIPVIVILTLASGVKTSFKPHKPKGAFEALIFAALLTAALLFFITISVLIVYRGSPDITSEGYVIVNHNRVVRSITENEYFWLCLDEGGMPAFGYCAFLSSLLWDFRRRLDNNKSK